MSDDFFAPPPFRPEDALATLRRTLREAKLVERAGRFEWRGQPVVELALADGAIRARAVTRPARSSSQWTETLLRSGADVRRFGDELKRQLQRWGDADE